MLKRYEIFISSTFTDLKEERRRLQEYIISQGHLPVGMELFNAGNEEQWRVIKRVIDQSDYYVLIVAARYGSIQNGLGFTEREFRYAKKTKKPIIAFLLSTEGEKRWPSGSVDNGQAREKLLQFRALVKSKYVYEWGDSRELMDQVRDHLFRWIEDHPQRGWIRAADNESRERHVYQYLFNALKRLPPHIPMSQDAEDLYDLSASLDELRSVEAAINALLSYYANPTLAKGIRAYFAYRLNTPIEIEEENRRFIARYRVGVTNSKERFWRLGIPLSEQSNVHRVFETGESSNVPNTSVASPDENHPIPRERSVFAAPVRYGPHTIGVVGLSSSKPDVTSKYLSLGSNLALLFGALFYAYGQKYAPAFELDEIAKRIREDVANHFEQNFQKLKARVTVVLESEERESLKTAVAAQ